MKHRRNLIIGVIVSVTATFVALQNVAAPTQDSTSESTVTFTVEPSSETFTPTYEGCGFMWAYHDAPELTQKVDEAVKALNQNAYARVTFYGEDCARADGHSTFGAMETDFYIHLVVDDLTDTESFGDWMAQVLPLIVQLPREEIQGNYGFVEFWFEHSEKELIAARVPIQKYLDEGQGKSGAELLQMFSNPP